MKIILLIAWRNVWRNKRRSLVVISSISMGIFAMILSMGLINGMNRQMVDNAITSSLGHLSMHKKGYLESMKPEFNFFPSEKILTQIKQLKNLVAFAPRIKAHAMLRSSEAARGIVLVGIDPMLEEKITKIKEYIIPDRQSSFLSDPSDQGILISRLIAHKLDLKPGDKLVVMIQDKGNEIRGVGMVVRALFETPIESFDKYIAYTGIKTMQSMVGFKDHISEINLILRNKDDASEAKENLLQSLGETGVEIRTWKEMAPGLVSSIALFDMMMYIFFSIVFATVIFSIANTLIMSIMERFYEIGVMKSIGTNPYWIFFMVLAEAITLSFVGLSLGILCGALVIAILSFTGLDFSFFLESMRIWGTGSKIYPGIKGMDLAVAVFIVLATTIIAALYPAFKAARIRPIEAVHFH